MSQPASRGLLAAADGGLYLARALELADAQTVQAAWQAGRLHVYADGNRVGPAWDIHSEQRRHRITVATVHPRTEEM